MNAENKVREAFEAAITRRYGAANFARSPEGYAHSVAHRVVRHQYADIQILWEVWQDALAARPADGVAVPAGWKLVRETPRELAERLYAEHPTYRGTKAIPWRDAPNEVKREWIDKATATLAATPATPEPTRSQKLRDAGYTTRPTWRSLPKDGDDDESTAVVPTVEAGQGERDTWREALESIASAGVSVSYPGHHGGKLHKRCNSCGARWCPGEEPEEHDPHCAAQRARHRATGEEAVSKYQMNLAGGVIGAAGFLTIVVALGWLAALGILVAMWGNNLANAARTAGGQNG